MKIILLSPYLPSIDTSACARKIYECIRMLHKRGHSIHLVSFYSEDDKKRIDFVKPFCAEMHLEYTQDYLRFPCHSTGISQKVESLCKNRIVNILQCENSYLSRYIPFRLNIPCLLVEHEVLSISFYERSKFEGKLYNKIILYARAIKKYLEEKKWYQRFNKIIVFSGEDKNTIYKLHNLNHTEIIPLGIDLDEYTWQHSKDKPYDLMFVGNFSHIPNTDAVLYFYKNILPLIKNKLPNISLIIVGMNPHPDIEKLAKMDKNITVTGYVKDISEYYYKSKVFIAPIRYGTGMRYKLLEALAFNMPIVATSVASRGILSRENIRIADTPNEFANAVIELFDNPDKYAGPASSGREVIEKYYSWDILLDKYENIYYDLLK